ncbi:twitching motility protein PilT [Echinicola strongylocentroti]|uniref:Twitching motility protein PilT n=1 Tax=Echinicola strongylocentroti TaxID=1795355 RepID=A0A2Z4IMB9_9BACT|nr:PIN domain-containing protein [Echinicola strongylocentroti]AWW32262.1 twitching motility protein PilT [Echinicola strongylocentroti]
MKLFLDANVLVSVLNKEYPLFPFSARVVSLVDRKEYQVYTSPICLAIAFYFSEKKYGTKVARHKIRMLSAKLSIASVTAETVLQASTDDKVHDFEDGLEYYSAMEAGCEYIITEDRGGFYYAAIPVMDSRTFIMEFFGKSM